MIALVTSEKWNMRSREDLFLKRSLSDAGLGAEIVPWTSDRDWAGYDMIILRSPWDYYEHYSGFCRWLRALRESGARVANGVDRILGNIDKPAQFALLARCPVRTPPTKIWRDVSEAVLPWDRTVIKPAVSAGGHNTFLIDKLAPGSTELLKVSASKILESGFAVVAQPYLRAIERGEPSLVFFHGVFSHGFLRFPGVLEAKKPAVPLQEIPKVLLDAGAQVCTFCGGGDMLYLRVDLVASDTGFLVMELECAEPDLSLSMAYPEGITPMDNFIAAIRAELERRAIAGR